MQKALWIAAVAGFSVSAVPTQAQRGHEVIEPSAKDMARLQQLTPEAVAAKVVVRSDDLETVAVLDTSAAFSTRGRFTDRVRSDAFLRALVDKSSGSVVYQVYQNVRYTGDLRGFTSANFATAEGPRSAAVQQIARRSLGCSYGLCAWDEDIAFAVPEDVLRQIAATCRPGSSSPWRFRFKVQNGIDWEDRLMPAEAAGLLLAVDRFRGGAALTERGMR